MNQDEWNKLFGSQVRQARLTLQLNQEDIATVLHIPRTALTAIESGTRATTSWEYKALSGLLGIRSSAEVTMKVVNPLKSKLQSLAIFREKQKLYAKIGEVPVDDPEVPDAK